MTARSPLHDVLVEERAHLVEVDGWLVPADFGDTAAEYAALRRGAALCDLSLRGKLRLTGPDRATFLHSMVTNDVLALRPGEGCLAAKLSVQGKMEAGLRILCLEDALLCDVDPGPAARLGLALEKHLVMEDARIADETVLWALLAVQGPGAARALAAAGAANVESLRQPLQHVPDRLAGAAVRLVRVDHCGEDGFDVWVPANGAGPVWRALRAPARPAGLAALDVRRIEAGIPWAGAEIDGEHFPMEADLDARWISLTKGCYLGQETVSRLHHLGHVNRHLRGFVLDRGAPVPPRGAAVLAHDEPVGQVTSATRSPALDRPVALGYVRHEHAAPGTRLVVETSGGRHPLTVSSLPLVRPGS